MPKWLICFTILAVLSLLAFFVNRPRLSFVSNLLIRSLARFTVKAKAIGKANEIAELGSLWQRSFPSKKQVPIENVAGNTVIAQIHTPCPLRGSGDVHACYRMMNFDREVVRRAGGQFVVLESQATPGVGVQMSCVLDLSPPRRSSGAAHTAAWPTQLYAKPAFRATALESSECRDPVFWSQSTCCEPERQN